MEQETSSLDPPVRLESNIHLLKRKARRHSSGRIHLEPPLEGDIPDTLYGLFQRIRLPSLLQRYASLPIRALFSFINGCISIGLVAGIAIFTNSPFIFPSLGSIACLCFCTPTAASASPRNVIVSHAVAAVVGYFSLVLTGLTMAGPALADIRWQRVVAAGLSLGLTAALMVLLKVFHPPAGATALVVSLGLMTQPWQFFPLMGGVILITLQAIVINRLAGIPYPLWKPLYNPSESYSGAEDGGADP